MADAILDAQEMKAVEQAAFSDGIDAESLMDRAGEGIANAILEQNRALVSALPIWEKAIMPGTPWLRQFSAGKAGWEIWTRSVVPDSDLQGLPRKKWQSLDAYRAPGPIIDLPRNRPRSSSTVCWDSAPGRNSTRR